VLLCTLLEGKEGMPNSRSAEPAEPMAGTECSAICNPSDDENPLTQPAKASGILPQPHLRIVHNADCVEHPSSKDMPPPDRPHPVSDRVSDRKPAVLDRTVQAQIGRMLREHFAGVAGEPVPERFIALLAELEAKETSR
jgi:hypothetical protein